MGKTPKEEECPPDFEDFPLIIQQAIETFNKLGDRVYPDIGYMGKDYTCLPLHLEILKITDTDEKDLFVETLLRLDSYMIERSAEELKKARKAATKK